MLGGDGNVLVAADDQFRQQQEDRTSQCHGQAIHARSHPAFDKVRCDDRPQSWGWPVVYHQSHHVVENQHSQPQDSYRTAAASRIQYSMDLVLVKRSYHY